LTGHVRMQYRCVRASECMNLVWSDLVTTSYSFSQQWEDLRSSRGRFAPPAGRWWGWAGILPLAARGGRRVGRREGPVLFECLERPDPYTIGHAAPRDRRGFDR